MRRLVVLLLLVPLAACGGHAGDLQDTCTRVARAWPGDLYDDATNAAFARRVEATLAHADQDSRRTFAAMQHDLRLTVAAHGDNNAVLTHSVDVLADLQAVDAACGKAGGPAIDR